MIPLDAKIWVAGHRGLVGSAIVRALRARGYERVVTRASRELDLRDQAAVRAFYAAERPAYVFVAAAKVGGILANDSYPAEFLYDNLMIEANAIHGAYEAGVEKLLFLGSTCIYPKLAPQPLKEEYLLTGPLEPTNEWYAVAKIAGIKLCQAYRRQYGAHYIAAMPTNLYGPGDNFDLAGSHVLPALIRKFHEAKAAGGRLRRGLPAPDGDLRRGRDREHRRRRGRDHRRAGGAGGEGRRLPGRHRLRPLQARWHPAQAGRRLPHHRPRLAPAHPPGAGDPGNLHLVPPINGVRHD